MTSWDKLKYFCIGFFGTLLLGTAGLGLGLAMLFAWQP